MSYVIGYKRCKPKKKKTKNNKKYKNKPTHCYGSHLVNLYFKIQRRKETLCLNLPMQQLGVHAFLWWQAIMWRSHVVFLPPINNVCFSSHSAREVTSIKFFPLILFLFFEHHILAPYLDHFYPFLLPDSSLTNSHFFNYYCCELNDTADWEDMQLLSSFNYTAFKKFIHMPLLASLSVPPPSVQIGAVILSMKTFLRLLLPFGYWLGSILLWLPMSEGVRHMPKLRDSRFPWVRSADSFLESGDVPALAFTLHRHG